MIQFIDLHTHSTASDGTDSPAQLVAKAAALKLAAVALTDHDSVDGLDEAEAASLERGIEFIRGCELSAEDAWGEVHLLGLWLPRNIQSLSAELATIRTKRGLRNRIIVEKLCALGAPITYEAVLAEAGGEVIGRPHIAQALMRAGHVGSVQEAFARFLRSGSPAYEPKQTISAREGIERMRALGATVALAHPMLLRSPRDQLETRIAALRGYGLDALEAYHSEHSPAGERFCVDMAHRFDMGLCGGSDYHGSTKPSVVLGRGRGGLRVGTAVLDALKARRQASGLPV